MSGRFPILVLVSLIVLVPGLVACGGGGGGGGGSDGGSEDKGFRVMQTSPISNEYAVQRDANIHVIFSDELASSTVTSQSFKVSEAWTGHVVPGAISIDSDQKGMVLDPTGRLALNTQYRVLATTDIENRFGERLKKDHESFFRTVVTETPSPEPPPPEPQGRLMTVGAMWTGRSSHSATRLSTGYVLVAGGWDSSTSLTATAELYVPATMAFSKVTNSLWNARANHTATLLSSGKVLIAGGFVEGGSNVTARCELYDPGTQSFTMAGEMTKPRCYHTATLLDDGRVLITGGAEFNASSALTSTHTAEIYDPQTGTFTALPNMSVFRSDHVATKLESGYVLITGGHSTSTTAELFDPSKDQFATISSAMKAARAGHTATRMYGGTVLILGGGDRSGSIYTPSTSRFENTPGIPLVDRTSHTADIIRNGRVLIAGGYAWNPAFVFHATMEYFNGPPGELTFMYTEDMLSYPRAQHRSTVLSNGDVLFTGGANLDPLLPELNVAELYTFTQQ
jgi:hypothetical protein